MICANCGESNPAEAKFCGHCGATISGPGKAAEATEAAGTNDQVRGPAGQWSQAPRPSTTGWAASPPPAPPVTSRPAPDPAVQPPPPRPAATPPSQPAGQWLVDNQSSTVASGEGVSSSLNLAVIIGSLIIPFIGMVAGVVYMADGNPAKKSAGKLWLIVGIISAAVWVMLASSSEQVLF